MGLRDYQVATAFTVSWARLNGKSNHCILAHSSRFDLNRMNPLEIIRILAGCFGNSMHKIQIGYLSGEGEEERRNRTDIHLSYFSNKVRTYIVSELQTHISKNKIK